jgi:hypothetical protein
LQHERGFAYAWLTPNEDERSRNNSAPKYAIQFRVRGNPAGLLLVVDFGYFLWGAGFFDPRALRLPTPFAWFIFLDNFLHIGVPFPAGRAFASPLRALGSAVLTEKGGFYFRQGKGIKVCTRYKVPSTKYFLNEHSISIGLNLV